MPDMCGYWDRRTDDPDFNPTTERIERGYAKRAEREYREEKQRERRQRKSKIKEAGLSDFDFEKSDYRIDYTGTISFRGVDIARAKQNRVVVEYAVSGDQSHPPVYDPTLVQQNSYALDFAEILKAKGIPIKEKPAHPPVCKSLEQTIKTLEAMKSEAQRLVDRL
jgi:hypothetical protein